MAPPCHISETFPAGFQAASTGLRRNEIFGLKWGDINREMCDPWTSEFD